MSYIAYFPLYNESIEKGMDFLEVHVMSYEELEKKIEDYFDEAHEDFENWNTFIEFVIDDIIRDLDNSYDNDLELCEVREEMLDDWK